MYLCVALYIMGQLSDQIFNVYEAQREFNQDDHLSVHPFTALFISLAH